MSEIKYEINHPRIRPRIHEQSADIRLFAKIRGRLY